MARKDKVRKERTPSRLATWWAGRSEQGRASFRRGVTAFLLTVVFGGAAVAGLVMLEKRVLRRQAAEAPRQVRVSLVGSPSWMPPTLQWRIVESVRPRGVNFAHADLTKEVHALAEANPWIRKVRAVRKRLDKNPQVGLIEIEAEYRRPVAMVLLRDEINYAYVDDEGIRLPTEQVPKYAAEVADRTGHKRWVYYVSQEEIPPYIQASRIHYINIQLYFDRDGDPPAPGRKWQCPALAEGIRLVKLIATRPYAWEVTTVDARNFNARISRSEPDLRMWAQVGQGPRTDIRFGRFPNASGDWVVSPERKMSYLDEFVGDHGRLAGVREYIDLRYDTGYESIN